VRSRGRPAPSRTAGLVALYRAIESARPAATRLFEDPLALRGYLAERGLSLIEDVDARVYRDHYLLPRGRGHEPLADFQRAALVEAGHR
jgi:O-methyltransferase involved in polyketide biosynthesis